MSGAGKTNGGRSLQELEALLPKAVFIPIPLGEKKPVDNGWQRTTFEQSQSPQYKARLREGNIGVLLGQPGGNLCAIDIDDDQEIQRFIDLNPQLTCTLCSAGARGCQIWVVVKGSYPHRIYKLQTTNHKKWGEWRADGGQSVICGLHPSGCTYRLLCDQPPITIRFEEIVWPEYLLKPWLAQTPQRRPSPLRQGLACSS